MGVMKMSAVPAVQASTARTHWTPRYRSGMFCGIFHTNTMVLMRNSASHSSWVHARVMSLVAEPPVAAAEQIREMVVVDPWTIRFRTATPYPLMPSDMTQVTIISKAADKASTDDFNSGKVAIGTGPYKVAHVEPGKKIVLEAFDKYFAGSPKGKPAIKRIVWRTISEVNTKLAELMTGGLDWCWLIPPDRKSTVCSRWPLQASQTSKLLPRTAPPTVSGYCAML